MSRSNIALALALAGVMGVMAAAASAAGSDALVERGELKITQQEFSDFFEVAIPADARAEILQDETRLRRTLAEYYVLRQLDVEATEAGVDRDPVFVKQLNRQRSEMLARFYLRPRVLTRTLWDATTSGAALPLLRKAVAYLA